MPPLHRQDLLDDFLDAQVAFPAFQSAGAEFTAIRTADLRRDAQGVAIARFAMHHGRRRAAILYENNAYGRGLADAFVRGFKGEIMSADPIGEGTQDFDSFVTLLSGVLAFWMHCALMSESSLVDAGPAVRSMAGETEP